MMLPRSVFGFLLLLLAVSATAQQSILPGWGGAPLQEEIRQLYTPDQTLGYSTARDTLYANIDAVDNVLEGVYTGFTVTLVPGQDPTESAFQNGTGINTEHVYPQSKGAGDEPQRSDMHNLFPTKVSVNGDRGSCRFSDIPDGLTDRWYRLAAQQSNIPSSDIDEYSEYDIDGCQFEPREARKGDIARAMFYFYTIYRDEADAEDQAYFPIQQSTLYAWHLADPVDAVELARTQGIAQRQGNVNPFVVDSSLVRRAYFAPDSVVSSLTPIVAARPLAFYPNPARTVVQLDLPTLPHSVAVYDALGRMVALHSRPTGLSVDVQALASGWYVLRVVGADDQVHVGRLHKE